MLQWQTIREEPGDIRNKSEGKVKTLGDENKRPEEDVQKLEEGQGE